jgi:hypothetical protein
VTGRHAERRSAIESALIDFQRAPGRYTVALRQPAPLFASIRELLQYAAGRSPEDGASPPSGAVVQAARFFIRTALLKPDADHYALLGLQRGADAIEIKERYRSLMRLTHPDFATSPGGANWPADAATRINQAYEVLSSPERRRTYDEAAEPPAPQPAPREVATVRSPAAAPTQRRGHSRLILKYLAAGFGALAAVALVALWAATASGERDSLVQRTTSRVVADRLPSLFAPPQPERKDTAEVAPPSAPQAEDDGLQAAIARALPAILAAPVAASAPADPVVPMKAPAVETAAARTDVPAEPAASPAPPAPVAASPVPAKPIVAAQTFAPAPRPVAAGPSMADIQPLVTRLLQDIESGWGDNVIASLDFGTRRSADAQSLARQLDALCDGARPVKISKVDLKGEPHEGKLVVIGQVILQVRDASTPTRRFALQAEFAQQGGAPVLTRLAPVTAQ